MTIKTLLPVTCSKDSLMQLREHYLNHSAKNRGNKFSQLTFTTSLTIALLLLSYLFFILPSNAEEKPKQVKKILLLHSFEPFLPYSITVNQSIRSTIESDKTIHADMYTEYLDLARFPDRIYHKRIHDLLRYKYSERPPDLIFVMLNPALDFFIKNVEDLFPGTPVVFCTIEKHQIANRQLKPDVTGVLMEIDPKNTLEAALKLQPDTQNVVVVGGAHKNDRGYEAVVREAFKDYEKKLNITYLTGMPMAEILKKVSTLPKKTIVLFVTMFQDGTGKSFVPRDVSAVISRTSNVPVYGLFDSYFSHGIVGGRLVSFEEQGKRAAQIGLEILHGRKPVEIPVIASPNVYKFDWRQLKRWGLSERNVPVDSSVAYKEHTLWDRYKWEILVVVVFFIIQLILISILLFERHIRKKTQIDLRESETKYRSIFKNSVEGIFQTTPEGRFISANPAQAQLFSYDSTQELMNQITDISRQHYVNPEDRETYKNTLEKNGVIKGFETQLLNKYGNPVWASISARAIKNDEGATIYYEGTVEDITSRKQAEEELFNEKEKLRILSENAPFGMVLINKNGQFLYANPKFRDIFGYDLNDIPDGKTWFKTAYPDAQYRHNVISTWLNNLNNAGYGEQRPSIFNVTCKDGSTKIISFIPVLLGNSDNMVVCEDITERKRLETQIINAQKMESIGTLAGGIAHDFNNLLMGIQGYASLILLDLDPSHPHYEKLTRIENQVQSGADLTRQLLGFARGGKYAVKPVNINELIEKTSAMFGRTRKEIAIHCEYQKNIWSVEADQGQIEQVLLNLYLNAWQAMPAGGDLSIETKNVVIAENHLKPYLMMPGRYVQISIKDTGEGMDEKTKERIFEPFFTTKEIGRGTGLGLAMVYGIIKNHNGFIEVISEPGKGTTFILYFLASDKAVVNEKPAVPEIMRGSETILLADDEPNVLEVNKAILEFLGYTVYAVSSGQEAITVYNEKKDTITLIILDMIMPGLSGSETFDRIREINPSAKIILSSGYSLNSQAQQIMNKGCRGFIQKPFDMTQISAKVRESLDK